MVFLHRSINAENARGLFAIGKSPKGICDDSCLHAGYTSAESVKWIELDSRQQRMCNFAADIRRKAIAI